jgi:hypothetical protein
MSRYGNGDVERPAVLEAYAAIRVYGLARRDGNRRYYDLLERLLPAGLLAQKVPLHEQLRDKMHSSTNVTCFTTR